MMDRGLAQYDEVVVLCEARLQVPSVLTMVNSPSEKRAASP